MAQFIRFQLYNEPNRKAFVQVHVDIPIEEPPKFAYGETVQVGSDEVNKSEWPFYVVAHVVHLKQEPNPERPDENKIIYEVYLARKSEWEQFELPQVFSRFEKMT